MNSTKQKQVPWNMLDMFLVIILELGVFWLIFPIIENFTPHTDQQRSFYVLIIYILQSAITAGILYLFTVYKYKTNIKLFGFNKIPVLKTIGKVFLIWLLTVGSLVIVSQLIYTIFGTNMPGFQEQQDHTLIFGQNIIGKLSLILSASIIAPIVEEIVFRGFILQGLLKYLSPLASILVSAALFAILHFEFGSVIPLFIIGSFLGWIYHSQKSIWGCLIFHAMNNGFALLAGEIIRSMT